MTAAAGLCGAVSFLVLCYPLLRGNIYHADDLGAYHFPTRAFYSYCLQNGLNPFWWPSAFCGYYLHGEGQVGMLHPLHWLAYRFLPLDWAFNLEFAAGYVWLYAGTAALLRHWRQPWYAALFGAHCFAFSGFTLFHFVHLQAIAIIGHLPWALLSLSVLLKSQNNTALRRAWLALALLVASQLLLGYPQYVLFTLLCLGLYAAACLRRPGIHTRLLWAGAGLAAGFAIGAAQVLPTFDLLQTVQRGGSGNIWRDGSMHPFNLIQFAGPYFFENRVSYGIPPLEYCLYTGVIPFLLAPVAMAFARHRGRFLVYLFAFQAPLALVLALGEYGGLYGLLAKLPVLGSFRCSARHIVLIHFALAMLAAFALPMLMARAGTTITRPGARLLLAIAATAGAVALLAALAIRHFGGEEARDALVSSPALLAAGPVLLVCGAGVVALALRWPRIGIACIMLFATLDIGLYAVPHVWGAKPQSTPLDGLLEVLQRELPDDPAFIPHDSEYRALGNWRTARLTALGLPNFLGYVGLPPAWALDPNAPAAKRAAGVRWEKQPLHAHNWTRHEDALPMARLVTHTVASENPRETIETIDVARTAIVESPVALPEGDAGTVVWIRNDPGDVLLETTTESEQFLVFAQRFHPGWTASIEGARVDLVRAYGDFMGCVVPAGSHRVQFSFAPPSLLYGLILSILGLIAAIVVYGTASWRSRRGCNTPPR